MQRIVFSTFLLLIVGATPLFAQEENTQRNTLELQCSVHFKNFNGVVQASTGMKVSLKNVKYQDGGAVLASQTEDYEFWVMSHSQQTIEDKTFINNYQVAIKDKKTGLFMHALSDTTYSPTTKPTKARISLVEYHPDSLMEKGELFFECATIE